MHQVRFLSRLALVALLSLIWGCASIPAPGRTTNAKDKASRAPFAWGILSEPKACVIFQEKTKTDVGFWVVVVTWKTRVELEVVETDGYVLQPKIWPEDQRNMDELQRRAMQDKIRYVKIQEEYTPEELEAARTLCRTPNLVK